MKESTRKLAVAMIRKMRLELVDNKMPVRKGLIFGSVKVYLLLVKLAMYII